MRTVGPMACRSSARPARHRFAAPLLLALLVVAAFPWARAVPAVASETVTRDIAGVSYTLPADWEKVEVPVDGLDSVDGLDECVVFRKDDGLFAALSFGGEGIRGASLDEMERAAADLGAAVSRVPDALAGLSLDSVSFSAAMEQGCPTLTARTDDIELNGVVYGFTLKLFSVENAADGDTLGTGVAPGDLPFGEDPTAHGVVMLSLLPASGTTTPDFASSFPVLDVPRRYEFAGVSYELPAGTWVAEGSVLGVDFLCAARGGAGMLGLALASPVLEFYATEDALLDDLQIIAERIALSLEDEPEFAGLSARLWAGAYRFAGMPTLGLEVVADADGAGERYVAVSTSFFDGGVSMLVLAEPLANGFVQAVLGSATASGPAGPAGADIAAQQDPLASDDDLGFVVGFSG